MKRWFEAIGDRPAVHKGLQVLADRRRPPGEMDEKARSVLFGSEQYTRR